MLPPTAIVEDIIQAAANAVRHGDPALLAAIDDLPLAVYAIDRTGLLTYFNPHCIVFAGRKPTVGRDRWCVSWKLYTEDGAFLPHDQCPMALVLQDCAAIRGVRAVVERPNGTRVPFMPFPTPVHDDQGGLLGAVNMLVDLSERAQAMFDDLYGQDLKPWYRAAVARALRGFAVDDLKALVAEMEAEAGRRPN
jgi:PAS domain-containing protein